MEKSTSPQQGSKSSTQQAASPLPHGSDEILSLLKRAGLPVTRDEYLKVAYFGEPPKEWTAELEAELPKELQDWSQFER